MDNEKKPEYLEKILKKGDPKAVNENPAQDQKKILAPLKDASTDLTDEKRGADKTDKIREKGKGFGRGIGGGDASIPTQPEGEYKSPLQKILEKGSRGGRGGTPTIKEPDEMLKEKNDVINPEDILSKNKKEKPVEIAMNVSVKATTSGDVKSVEQKQQKQESQPQQAKHKSPFLTSLDAKIQILAEKQEVARIPTSEKSTPKREGIISKIEQKVDAIKKATSEKTPNKAPKAEIAKPIPKPIIKGR